MEAMEQRAWGWPEDPGELAALQERLAGAAASAVAAEPWQPDGGMVIAGCFVAYARGTVGPGRPGDTAWGAAVAWRRPMVAGDPAPRRSDRHLTRSVSQGRPRRADDVVAQHVVSMQVQAPYVPGLLAARDGPVLAAALAGLGDTVDVVLVDASGVDHPRRAGLAVHLGAVIGLPTVGVTRRPLLATGDRPASRRGAQSPLLLDGGCVGYWVCTKTGTQPLCAHAGWRTSPESAARTLLYASTPAARTPVPLQEARRVAREARSLSVHDR